MKVVKVFSIIMLIVLFMWSSAVADCCGGGATIYEDWFGEVKLDFVNGAGCPIFVDGCTVIDYHWKTCDEGVNRGSSYV